VAAFRDFCRIDLVRERVPKGTTLLQFRHLLEQHHLGAALFAKVGELLLAQGLKLSGGTIVDATLIAAPPSSKNEPQSRDPEMRTGARRASSGACHEHGCGAVPSWRRWQRTTTSKNPAEQSEKSEGGPRKSREPRRRRRRRTPSCGRGVGSISANSSRSTGRCAPVS
jgi:IS5 family transposase